MESNLIKIFCSLCKERDKVMHPLTLKIIETTTNNVSVINRNSSYEAQGDRYDKFQIEIDDGLVEYKPEFSCTRCGHPAYDVNLLIEYDDDNELLLFKNLDPDEPLGYKMRGGTKTVVHQEVLPEIERPSKAVPV
jgi:hypothetical protein